MTAATPLNEEQSLRELLEFWTHEGRLQTFEDRERFRAAAARALSAGLPKETASEPPSEMVQRLLFDIRAAMLRYGTAYKAGDEEGIRSSTTDACELLDQLAALAAPPKPTGEVGESQSPTHGMNLGQRIKHVGGRMNAAGYVEFGSEMAVKALVDHVLRDLAAPPPSPTGAAKQPVDRLEELRQMLESELAKHRAAAKQVRMLTEDEAVDCECSRYALTARAIQRKFMEVNGLGTEKPTTGDRT